MGCWNRWNKIWKIPGIGEPTNIFEKVEDCAVVNDLTGSNSSISPHFPWDDVSDYSELKEYAYNYGLCFDLVNSNTFQDFSETKKSYKFGSLTNNKKN